MHGRDKSLEEEIILDLSKSKQVKARLLRTDFKARLQHFEAALSKPLARPLHSLLSPFTSISEEFLP